MRQITDVENDIRVIEELVGKYGFNKAGLIGITEIGYGLLELIAKKYNESLRLECPEYEEFIGDIDNEEFLTRVKRDAYGGYAQVKEKCGFYPLFQFHIQRRKLDELLAFCTGIGADISSDASALDNALRLLESDIEEAKKVFVLKKEYKFPYVFIGIIRPEEDKLVWATGLSKLLTEHNFVDYGIKMYSSIAEYDAAIAEEENKEMRAHILVKFKESWRNVDPKIVLPIQAVIKRALEAGVSMARILAAFEMKKPSKKAVEQMGGDDFLDIHALLHKTLSEIDDLSFKIGQAEYVPSNEDESLYNGYLDILYPFHYERVLGESMLKKYQPWDIFVDNARASCKSQPDDSTRTGLHYQGPKALIADYNTVVENISEVVMEMTKRGNEYIYPRLTVTGIESYDQAKSLSRTLTSRVNSVVKFYAVVNVRPTSDGTYMFEIDDDESWK